MFLFLLPSGSPIQGSLLRQIKAAGLKESLSLLRWWPFISLSVTDTKDLLVCQFYHQFILNHRYVDIHVEESDVTEGRIRVMLVLVCL